MDLDFEAFARAKRLFDRYLDLPPERWRARVERLRLDPKTHEFVLELFAAHDRSGGLLDQPLLPSAQAGALAGRQLGPWTLEAELGRGGSAVVYRARARARARARDHHGAERVAAVKLLTLGSLARAGTERFYQEQRILARLNHPHIASLFDLGRADDGTLWLAMALVEGQPIDRWCEEQRLSPHAIVSLFLDVCDAVAYAHRNLVVHRDIKPSNVLIDEHGHVRLLDFGIARLLDDDTAATETQWRMLTPQYAAPEQFGGALPSTTMDVYGLGALLYRLLSGRAPRALGETSSNAPAAPSRVAGDPAVAARLRGDLDRVVLKALATLPEERYASVADLMLDLRRWLQHEPVSATEPSLRYRLRKFVMRHRLGVGAAAAVTLALLAGVMATLWQSQLVRQEAMRAQQEAARAQQEAKRATAAQSFITSMLSDASPSAYGGVTTDIRDALERGAERARTELKDSPELQAELLSVIGNLQSLFGQYVPARRQLEDAFELVKSDSRNIAIENQILVGLGQLDWFDSKFGDAIGRLDTVVARTIDAKDPSTRELLVLALTARANTFQHLGKLSSGLADLDLAERVDASLLNRQPQRRRELLAVRGKLLVAAGRYVEADVALAAARQTGSERPNDYLLYEMSGDVAEMLGNYSEAERAYRHALTLVQQGYPPESSVLAQPYSYLAHLYRRSGRLNEAVEMSRKSLASLVRGTTPDNPGLYLARMNLGGILRDSQRYDEALPHLERATRDVGTLFNASPNGARVLANLALALAETGQKSLARQAIGASLAQIKAAQSAGIEFPYAYSTAYTLLARTALELGDGDQALYCISGAEKTASSTLAWTDPALVDLAALRVKAMLLQQRTYEAGMLGLALQFRLGRLPAGLPLYERAEALSILARAALARADFTAAAVLAADALQREPGMRYPSFVQGELDTLSRSYWTP